MPPGDHGFHMTVIDLIYFNAGGGHRAAALALDAAIREQHLPWQVRLVNLVEVLDPEAAFRRYTGMPPEDLYNKRLARGWTLGMAQELKLLQGIIRLGHNSLGQRLARHWSHTRPDMVVSLVPNFNRVLCESLAASLPGVPFATVMTDMADHPPNFWLAPGQPQHLVCGTAEAITQARAAGHPEALLHRSSGMLIHPDFYRRTTRDRAAERLRLGLPATGPVGVVMFGGSGAKAMDSIARALPQVPLILLCGHDAALAERLRAQAAVAPRAVLGFTREVRHYMALGDFFIGKPGPGSLSEAVQQGLPVVTVRNAFTMPQERYNTVWLQQHGLGLVLRRYAAVGPAVATLLADLPAYRARVAAVRNRAVFEVPAILARILEDAAAARDSNGIEAAWEADGQDAALAES